MTPEEYAAQQAVITAAVAAYVQRFASLFVSAVLSPLEWLKLLQFLFPEVERRYAEAAVLGRRFYDSQRVNHHPELPRNERLLSTLDFKQFAHNMEPARKEMSQADSPKVAITKLALTAVREVEMAGRRQIIGAVENDDLGTENKIIQGWARIATGRETCAWCLMLISRGAELNHKGNFAYSSAQAGGINLDDETVADLWQESGGSLKQFREDTKDYINQWHTGCDCLVVPVFDVQNWPGRNAALQAQKLWIEATKEARKLLADGKARSNNLNKETQNYLRRQMYAGEIDSQSYAFAA